MQRRLTSLVLGIALSVGVLAPSAFAAVKFHAGPTFTDEGTTLNVTGNVSGLGNDDLTVVLDASGIASVICRNPAGHRAPGQDTAVDASGSVEGIEVKNGRASFDVTTAEPTVSSDACPNDKWTAIVTDVAFSSATLTLIQDGETVFQDTYDL